MAENTRASNHDNAAYTWLVFSSLSILLLMFSVSPSAIASDCGQELDYCVGSQCFCSLEAAESFLQNQEPRNYCLEFSEAETLNGLPLLKYVCKPRPPSEYLGTLYAPGGPTGGWGEPCGVTTNPYGGVMPVFTCDNEAELISRWAKGRAVIEGCIISIDVGPDFFEPFTHSTPGSGPAIHPNNGAILTNTSSGGPCVPSEYARTATMRHYGIDGDRCDHDRVYESSMGIARYKYTLCDDYFNPWGTVIDVPPFSGLSCPLNLIKPDEICNNGATGRIVAVSRQIDDCAVGNPCVPSSGNKMLPESDWAAQGWEFRRHYNSVREFPAAAGMGDHWTHNFGARIINPDITGNQPLFFSDENNLIERFISLDPAQGLYRSTNKLGRLLYRTAQGFEIHRASSEELYFNDSGQLLRIHQRDNPLYEKNLSYVDEKLTEVIDGLGRVLRFTYAQDKLDSVQFPDQTSVLFTYTAVGDLERVDRLDANAQLISSRQYVYENITYTGHVTGIIDENGVRITTYAYDDFGRVISSQRANGTEKVLIEYPSASNGFSVGQRKVTLNDTEVRFYNYHPAGNHSGLRRLDSLTVNGNETTQNFYDGSQQLNRRVDPAGYETRYAYDSMGRVFETIEAFGLAEEVKTTKTWNTTHNRIDSYKQFDANDQLSIKKEFSYDSSGRIVAECLHDFTDPIAMAYSCGSSPNAPTGVRQTRYLRCEQGDLDIAPKYCPAVGVIKSIDGPRTDVSDITEHYYFSADAPGCLNQGSGCTFRKGDLAQVINPLSQSIAYVEYDQAGRPRQVENANGVVTSMVYDARGRLASQTVDGSMISYTYLLNGLVSRITQPDGSVLDFEYDAAQRLDAIENALGERMEYVLDAEGNRTQERYLDETSTLRFEINRVFDQLGRLDTETNGAGGITDYRYNAVGNIDSVQDPLTRTTSHGYDGLKRLRSTLDALQGITLFDYDTQSRLTEVIDPEGTTTRYVYNTLGDLIEQHSPDTGLTIYEYNQNGDRTAQVDARGVRSEYLHDDLGRTLSVSYPQNPSLNVGFDYDTLQPDCPAGEDYPVGHRTRMTDASGETRYCFDARGNMTRKIQVTQGTSGTVIYTYTASNRVQSITYPSGHRVIYGRDLAGQVDQVSIELPGGSTQPLLTDVRHQPFGPIEYLHYADGFEMNYGYNLAYWTETITAALPSNLDYSFSHDLAGNIAQFDEGPFIRELNYDELHRLIEFDDQSKVAHPLFSYQYDGVGNRQIKQSWEATQLVTENYQYAVNSNRLEQVDATQRGYDATGNTLSGMTADWIPVPVSSAYDERNRLAQATIGALGHAAYQYNGLGERVFKDVQLQIPNQTGTARYIYGQQGQLLSEYVDSGKFPSYTEYVWLNQRPVALIRDGQVYYIQSDHLGTPRRVIEPVTHTVRWHWPLAAEPFGDHHPYEDPAGTGSPFELNLRFPGQYYDAETGLHYNYFRDYEPGTGRYVQSDPIGLVGGMNTYLYVNANSLNYIDPTGLYWPGSLPSNCSIQIVDNESYQGYKSFENAPWIINKEILFSGIPIRRQLGRSVILGYVARITWQQVTYNFYMDITDIEYLVVCADYDECGYLQIDRDYGYHFEDNSRRLEDSVREWEEYIFQDIQLPYRPRP